MNSINEEVLSAYVNAEETINVEIPKTQEETIKEAQREMASKMNPAPTRVDKQANKNSDDPLEYKNNLGYTTIPIDTLPTQGLFYPEGTRITIRAAKGAEIKHWSTMNATDVNAISQTDDILNYIIERCVKVSMPGIPGSSWKDIKEVDRFYLLLAIREYTFIDDKENQLMVPISETEEMPVRKDMVDFIKIPEELMKWYSSEERCFICTLKTGKTLKFFIPTVGISQWLKNYARAKAQAGEPYDEDFILYAGMLINDYRYLSQRAYEAMVAEAQTWSAKEWSLVAYIRDQLNAAAVPSIKYTKEDGTEVEQPFTFRGGLKAIFCVHDPLSILC